MSRKVTVARMERPGRNGRTGSEPAGKGRSATYRRLWDAVRTRKQITCTYGGRRREACPTILGYNKDVGEAVLVFQFGGESTTELPPGGEWRCFVLARVTNLSVRDGRWHG